jgi:hypothetical protein
MECECGHDVASTLFIVTNAGKSLGLDALMARKPFGPFAGDGSLARAYRRVA